MKSLSSKIFLGLVCVAVGFLCGYFLGQRKRDRIESVQSNHVVATYTLDGDRRQITYQDIVDSLGINSKEQARLQYQQQKQAVDQIFREQLQKKYDLKDVPVPDPSQEEISKMLAAMKIEPRKATAKILDDIKMNLKAQNRKLAQEQFLRQKVDSARLQLQFAPPVLLSKEIENGKIKIFGSGKAPVSIVFYGSVHCGQCAQAYGRLKELQQKYTEKIQIYFKYFGDDPVATTAFRSAKALYCAQMLTPETAKLPALFEALYLRPPTNDEEILSAVAAVELTSETAKSCLNDVSKDQMLLQDRGTVAEYQILTQGPGFIINGALVPASEATDYLHDVVDYQLAH